MAYKHFLQSAFALNAQVKLALSTADYIHGNTTLTLVMISLGEISQMCYAQ